LTGFQQLGAWLANNWRPTVMQEATVKSRIRCTALDVICREQPEALENKLKEMLNLDVVDLAKPNVFGQRMRAAKEIQDAMSAAEREEILKKVEIYKTTGLPVETQKQYELLLYSHLRRY
jgi:uncharacterized protein (DUF111 family)